MVALVHVTILSRHATDYDWTMLSLFFRLMDATHVNIECYYYGLKNLHDRAEFPGSCRTYNIVSNDRRKNRLYFLVSRSIEWQNVSTLSW